jgi:hypothetical protein
MTLCFSCDRNWLRVKQSEYTRTGMSQIVAAGLRSTRLEGLQPNASPVHRILGYTQTHFNRSIGDIANRPSDRICVTALILTNVLDGTWDLRLQA